MRFGTLSNITAPLRPHSSTKLARAASHEASSIESDDNSSIEDDESIGNSDTSSTNDSSASSSTSDSDDDLKALASLNYRILAYGECLQSLQDEQATFFIVCNVHGIVKAGIENDVNSLPAIKDSNIWNENGEQEQIDIQFLSDQEGEALWNKVRRA